MNIKKFTNIRYNKKKNLKPKTPCARLSIWVIEPERNKIPNTEKTREKLTHGKKKNKMLEKRKQFYKKKKKPNNN